jgi:hypothetical protein
MFSFKRSLIALVGVLAVVGTLATLLPLVSRGQGGNPLTRDTRRSYYQTQTPHTAHQAPTACVEGYHMSSLWEIFDTSNLRYNAQLGLTQADSGFGPPAALVEGWIRTGMDGNANGTPGFANCQAYTSGSLMDEGTVVRLTSVWGSTSDVRRVSPWSADTASCASPRRVWCVQD